MQQLDAVARTDQFLGELGESGVDLDAEDGAGGIGEARRQAAGAAANLDGQVFLRQVSGTHDQVDEIEVNEEILAELVLRLDAVLLEQGAQVRLRLTRGRCGFSHCGGSRFP